MNSPFELTTQATMAEICITRDVPFVWFGRGTMLVSGHGMKEILGALMQKGYLILGCDGFDLKADEIIPRLDRIFDAEHSGNVGIMEYVTNWEESLWIDIAYRIQN